MGALRIWSGWKHSSHKLVSLCVEASHRGSKDERDLSLVIGNLKLAIFMHSEMTDEKKMTNLR
jgi:hypothetical protein